VSLVHPTAIIEDGARLHPSVAVGPYAIVEAGAEIGEGCVLESSVRIYQHTRMGRNNRVRHGAVLGCEPQDLIFTPQRSRPLTIGDNNDFREGVNISRGVKSEAGTRIGSNNYFMAFSHVGHDSLVGDHNIFANTATLAGHVEVEHHTFLSGHTAVHQFCRIGAYAIVGGVSGVPQDVPPYVMADGHRAEVIGLNLVGLRRNGFDQDRRRRIKQAYRIIYKSGLHLAEALSRLEAEDPSSEDYRCILEFFRRSTRGVIPHR
jgi:UDP-N-acetylglucosamine acyltransferase